VNCHSPPKTARLPQIASSLAVPAQGYRADSKRLPANVFSAQVGSLKVIRILRNSQSSVLEGRPSIRPALRDELDRCGQARAPGVGKAAFLSAATALPGCGSRYDPVRTLDRRRGGRCRVRNAQAESLWADNCYCQLAQTPSGWLRSARVDLEGRPTQKAHAARLGVRQNAVKPGFRDRTRYRRPLSHTDVVNDDHVNFRAATLCTCSGRAVGSYRFHVAGRARRGTLVR
jgi:hypothetical protein